MDIDYDSLLENAQPINENDLQEINGLKIGTIFSEKELIKLYGNEVNEYIISEFNPTELSVKAKRGRNKHEIEKDMWCKLPEFGMIKLFNFKKCNIKYNDLTDYNGNIFEIKTTEIINHNAISYINDLKILDLKSNNTKNIANYFLLFDRKNINDDTIYKLVKITKIK